MFQGATTSMQMLGFRDGPALRKSCLLLIQCLRRCSPDKFVYRFASTHCSLHF